MRSWLDTNIYLTIPLGFLLCYLLWVFQSWLAAPAARRLSSPQDVNESSQLGRSEAFPPCWDRQIHDGLGELGVPQEP
ncbi:hypothetical protein BDY24DRAFT_419500 [Mrakia frigida]|uniref:uncharacterized protein n=1 Tax=Mrakia frigida TaxID=29902 RepID=UPI003FCC212A